ncbi:unnamed protein product [Bathycoccus prasinos]
MNNNHNHKVPETSFFRILNWERYVPYNSKIALVGTIVLTGAVANIALSVWGNNKNIHKRTKNKNE